MNARPAPPHRTWTEAQWVAWRERQVAACERFGPDWTRNVGRDLVRMADAHLARLRRGAPTER